ncbi:hypothetical protein D1AOALGA4SA_6381 [Olavius algarvensis Delta 1 endosymbiont]|nr:hypothetical protein D1AOALGA4SA_6381 [Olavius algarvensis Delta 1 endosymbiont]
MELSALISNFRSALCAMPSALLCNIQSISYLLTFSPSTFRIPTFEFNLTF